MILQLHFWSPCTSFHSMTTVILKSSKYKTKGDHTFAVLAPTLWSHSPQIFRLAESFLSISKDCNSLHFTLGTNHIRPNGNSLITMWWFAVKKTFMDPRWCTLQIPILQFPSCSTERGSSIELNVLVLFTTYPLRNSWQTRLATGCGGAFSHYSARYFPQELVTKQNTKT